MFLKKLWYYILPTILTFTVVSCGGDDETSESGESGERDYYQEVQDKNKAEEKALKELIARNFEQSISTNLTGDLTDYFTVGASKIGVKINDSYDGDIVYMVEMKRNDKEANFLIADSTYYNGCGITEGSFPYKLVLKAEVNDESGIPIDVEVELDGSLENLFTAKAGESVWIKNDTWSYGYDAAVDFLDKKEKIGAVTLNTILTTNSYFNNKDEDESDESSEYGDDSNFGGSGKTSEWIEEYANILDEYLDIVSDIDMKNPDISAISEITALEMRMLKLTQKIEKANPSPQDLKRLAEVQAKYTKAAAKMGGF